MQTLEVTDEQYAVVQQLRDEIGDHVVGKYGYVRERDAVQFLIDNLHDELELEPEPTADGADVGEDIDTDADLQRVSYDEADSVDDPADSLAEGASDEPVVDRDSGTEPTADGRTDGPAAPADDRPLGTPEAPTDDADDDERSGFGNDEPDGGDSAADDDEMLDEMLNLLETYADKWTESASADARYAVTLPDGSTETVQTKDDIRALLFKHYQ